MDTSAVLELRREGSPFHVDAKRFFEEASDLTWCVLNATSHETFTRQRYDVGLDPGLETYHFMRGEQSDNSASTRATSNALFSCSQSTRTKG